MDTVIPESLQPYIKPEMLTDLAIMAGKTLVILIIGWIVAGWFQRLATGTLTRAKVDAALAAFLAAIVRYAIIFAVIIAAADAVGIETTSLTAIFASAGLAVGLALQGSLGNFASGVMILFFRPFTIGDVVTTGGTTGKVESIGLFATELSLPDGTRVIAPNGGVAGGEIRNHVAVGKRRATIDIGVDYGTDMTAVREALTKAVTSVHTVLEEAGEKQYAIVFMSFGGSSLDWQVHAWFTVAEWWPGQEKVRVAIYDELNAAGIGIPFPQLDVHFDSAPPTA